MLIGEWRRNILNVTSHRRKLRSDRRRNVTISEFFVIVKFIILMGMHFGRGIKVGVSARVGFTRSPVKNAKHYRCDPKYYGERHEFRFGCSLGMNY
jgi:hypothetical protein